MENVTLESSSVKSGVAGKADFDDIYDQPDPRAYYNVLGSYDYEVPQHGKTVFQQVLQALPVDRPTVVDLCCSYGVNAALLKHEVQLSDLYDHYLSDELANASSEDVRRSDLEFFADKEVPNAPEVIGIDAASAAIEYAVQVGLLDGGTSENLEAVDPSPKVAETLAGVDLVTVTGGIGYITERTFDRILSCSSTDQVPWVASLCLRTVPFDPIADCLAEHGLVTEHLEGVALPQRRFATEDERTAALKALIRRGIDPNGLETEGSYYVDVYLSRPADEAGDRSVDEILSDIPRVNQ